MLVGALFIVSGLIKANDTTGFAYKLDEYFTVFGTPWMSDFSVFLAGFICVMEIVLGVAVIFGIRMVPVSWLLLLMIIFFTFLTFYSAWFNKVTDCGCFGDALKLTPWQSFWKDIVLLFFTGILFLNRKKITPGDYKSDIINSVVAILLIAMFSMFVINWDFPIWFALITILLTALLKKSFSSIQDFLVIGISTIASVVFTYICLAHLPLKDFRPYAIGKNINEGMAIPAGAPQDSIVMLFQYTKDGQKFEFAADALPEDLDEYTFVDRFDKVIRKGYIPPIHDFTITDESGADYTEEYLNEDKYSMMLVAYNLDLSNTDVQPSINELSEKFDKAGIRFFGLTSTPFTDTDKFRHEHQNTFPYYSCDATTLKTIVRSNPGLVLIKNGTVVMKWHYNDLPEFDAISAFMNK